MRTFGPPVAPPVEIPNEEALYTLLDSIPPARLHLGPTGRRVIRGLLRIFARELSQRGVHAPGHCGR